MSVTAHRSDVETQVGAPRVDRPVAPRAARRVPAPRPPTRRRVVQAGVPRVVASCAPRRPRLSAGWVLAVASAACAAVVGLGALSGAVEPAVPSETTVVRVKPGESLWELAGRVAPRSDASVVVERIRELNGVEGTVRPGQPLTVPFEG
ncbi:Tfp pilus assembly protein FimV [Actinophytocola algeriensis]|uniref:Tfp pilus assembly protein FimV n=1 Tax=Actinophytocola algeriensis TaxID=1768010 RepID=A0A7W7Q0S3_9PSEU|nr:LysM peptidoglycan-binding domain-containing protein [Actinophytocola algeriensis]MBB4904869.1 Tfp pilus assembly protein FimV [Actinophytocola algeriensis]MBE1476272.1 Tfp pilus assembly protein FimV [Actinophytocola algeriensis]